MMYVLYVRVYIPYLYHIYVHYYDKKVDEEVEGVCQDNRENRPKINRKIEERITRSK